MTGHVNALKNERMNDGHLINPQDVTELQQHP